jgi:energy-coupling factor transporter ATP-binding protein EcfA2
VIRRFYVHNFRCLENFELPIAGLSSVLLIGNNGSGKTTVRLALEILQKIARGASRVGVLVKPKDFTSGRTDVPMRFEIEVQLNGGIYGYVLAFEFPEGSTEARVLEEKLTVDGNSIFARAQAQVQVTRKQGTIAIAAGDPMWDIDRHLVALPIIQERSQRDPLFLFKQWLARILILGPIPSLISGDSDQETLQPDVSVTNFGAWFSGVLAHAPAAYAKIETYLKQVMPDLEDIRSPVIGKTSRSLVVRFAAKEGSPLTQERLALPFEDLSDGEKCFMICALVLAANDAYGPVLCFWDEPDNYLAMSEVGQFVLALRKAFQDSGQFIATSHNPEAIRRFSEENTLVLYRKNHLEPTTVRKLADLHFSGDLVGALIRGDIEP